MPNFAIIENGKVVNVVVAEPDIAAEQNWVPLTGDAGIGWDYVDGQLVNNIYIDPVQPAPAPTKEQLLAELQALTAKINALG